MSVTPAVVVPLYAIGRMVYAYWKNEPLMSVSLLKYLRGVRISNNAQQKKTTFGVASSILCKVTVMRRKTIVFVVIHHFNDDISVQLVLHLQYTEIRGCKHRQNWLLSLKNANFKVEQY